MSPPLDTFLWTLIECEGPPPAPRLDHILCAVKIPIFGESTSEESVGRESEAKPTTRTDLEVDQHQSGVEASNPQLVTVLSADMVASGFEEKRECGKSGHTRIGYQTVLMIIGGMDTLGTIFEDCLVFPVEES